MFELPNCGKANDCGANELCFIVKDDDPRQSDFAHDFMPVETVSYFCCNFGDSLRLYPFCEVVDSYNNKKLIAQVLEGMDIECPSLTTKNVRIMSWSEEPQMGRDAGAGHITPPTIGGKLKEKNSLKTYYFHF